MSRIFISHSSTDKAFVRKLAADLTEAGLRVWFDNWDLELGDQIYKAVLSAIDDSSYVVLVLSPHSVRSCWVHREIDLALSQEQNLGRNILVPIILQACEIPEALEDRVYANAVENYRDCAETLIRFFSSKASLVARDDPDRLFVIRPKRGYHLNEISIDNALGAKALLQSSRRVKLEHLVIVDDEPYVRLRDQFFRQCDRYETNPESSIYLLDQIEGMNLRLRRLEAALMHGLLEILNNASALDKSAAASQFVKLLRFEAILLMNAVAPTHSIVLPYALDMTPLSNNVCSANFYGDERHVKVDIYNRKNRASYFSIFTNPDLSDMQYLHGGRQIAANDFRASEIFWDYLIPQMVAKHFFYNEGASPLEWSFEDWQAGLG